MQGNVWQSRAAAAAKSLQSCPTLCDPIDGSPPGSPIPGILQARTLECVAISFSNAWKWKVKEKLLSRVWLFGTPRTAAYQASLSTISWSLLKLMFIELAMPLNHLALCCPLLLPWIFPSIRVFSNESALCIRWLKYGYTLFWLWHSLNLVELFLLGKLLQQQT